MEKTSTMQAVHELALDTQIGFVQYPNERSIRMLNEEALEVIGSGTALYVRSETIVQYGEDGRLIDTIQTTGKTVIVGGFDGFACLVEDFDQNDESQFQRHELMYRVLDRDETPFFVPVTDVKDIASLEENLAGTTMKAYLDETHSNGTFDILKFAELFRTISQSENTMRENCYYLKWKAGLPHEIMDAVTTDTWAFISESSTSSKGDLSVRFPIDTEYEFTCGFGSYLTVVKRAGDFVILLVLNPAVGIDKKVN